MQNLWSVSRNEGPILAVYVPKFMKFETL